MVRISNVVQGKEIGKGIFGTIFDGTNKNDNKYAIKIEQILKKDYLLKDTRSYKSAMWREIEFAETMYKLYPNHFMQLYDYDFVSSCEHKQSWNGFAFKLEDLPPKYRKLYIRLQKSKYCSIKLWSRIDLTLHTLLQSWKTFNYNVFYDLFIQIIYVVYLMNKHGYFHNDFHTKNIGIKYTKQKYIIIFGTKIPTHGMFVQAIDYGLVLHKKYDLKKWEINKLENDNDIFTILNTLLISFTHFKHYYKKEKIQEYVYAKINKTDYNFLKNTFSKKIKLSKENEKFLIDRLYKYLFYTKYEKQLLKSKFTIPIPPDYFLPHSIILKIFYNIYDIKDILKYTINNRSI
jgi:hypothetical protein